MVRKHVSALVHVVNLPRAICKVTLGHHHKQSHRLVAGACVMAVGVVIMKSAGHFHYEWVAWTVEGVGGAVHGMGLTPYIEILLAEDV